MKKKTDTKTLILLITFGVILFVALWNIRSIFGLAGKVVSAALPILVGLAMAFILNVPMSFLENKVFGFMGKSRFKFIQKLRRPLCLILTVVLALLLIAVVIAILIPNLIKAIGEILENLDAYSKRLPTWLTKLFTDLGISNETASKYYFSRESIIETIISYVTEQSSMLLSRTASITLSVFSTLFNLFISLIVCIYMLACKERVYRMLQRIMLSFTGLKFRIFVNKVGNVAYNSFRGFIVGQFTDSLILGVLCYIGMVIFGFPYAGVVSIVVGVFQLVPIIGGMISITIGTLLMLTRSPLMAITFILYLIIVQQIEGNLIYPRIVGNKVGLPGLLVVSGVIFCGNLFGIVGILLGVPTLSTLYALLKIALNEREEKKAAEAATDAPVQTPSETHEESKTTEDTES